MIDIFAFLSYLSFSYKGHSRAGSGVEKTPIPLLLSEDSAVFFQQWADAEGVLGRRSGDTVLNKPLPPLLQNRRYPASF
jgi:hypothetical protein